MPEPSHSSSLSADDILLGVVQKVGRFAVSYATKKEWFLDPKCSWSRFARKNQLVLAALYDAIAIVEAHLRAREDEYMEVHQRSPDELYSISRVVHSSSILLILAQRREDYIQEAIVAAHIKVAHMVQYVADDRERRQYHPYCMTLPK